MSAVPEKYASRAAEPRTATSASLAPVAFATRAARMPATMELVAFMNRPVLPST
jgi:hypothetical protein